MARLEKFQRLWPRPGGRDREPVLLKAQLQQFQDLSLVVDDQQFRATVTVQGSSPSGSTGWPPSRTSKCRCGPVQMPEQPT